MEDIQTLEDQKEVSGHPARREETKAMCISKGRGEKNEEHS